MKAYYSPVFELPLPPTHRFPMAKYRLLHQQVSAMCGKWGIQLLPADPIDRRALELIHDPMYLERVFDGALSDVEIRRIGFPWSPELVVRSQRSTGATVQAAAAALHECVAVNLAGGTHHAQRDQGQGYCLFNDVAVAIAVLRQQARGRRFVVIDCDVHQGNGTAAIFADDPDVFTFSLHGARNFPFTKIPSDLDIALPDGAGDNEYLQTLEDALPALPLDTADVVFYIAGADPYAGDRLGRMKLTIDGLAARDKMVLSACGQRRVPVAIAMAGGYADNVHDIVQIHAQTIRTAAEFARQCAT